MLRLIAAAIALPLLATPSLGAPFYEGTWSPSGGLCDDDWNIRATRFSVLFDEMGACRLSQVEEDGDIVTAETLCSVYDDAPADRDTILLERVDDDTFRMTFATAHEKPTIYHRCTP